MKKILGLSLALSAALVFSNVAVATGSTVTSAPPPPPEQRVAVVQIAKVLHDSPQVKKDVDQLKTQFKKDQDAIQVKQDALQKKIDVLNKNEPVMSAADKAKTEKELAEERQALIKEIGDFQKKLTAAQKSMMDVVFKELNEVIQTVAKERHFSVVLDSQFVLYAVPTQDITAEVEKAFDAKGHKKDKK
ncbi:MAG: OmpH family outer membrane protein [Gammaproteobacteria bacterium]|nr:OmpH family outer membrane protein [Gammaproteobacteria bacterium]